jgi:uncharacterized membrane protein YphA (DoxX/SURF4 family)
MGSFMTFIGWVETICGIGVLIGLWTSLAALGLGIVMAGAIYKKTQEWHVPFTAMDKTGWELDLMILAGCVVLLMMGSGPWSVDMLWAY